MSYNSYIYLFVFLTATLLLYYIFPKKVKWIVLLVSSYAFYYISSGKYIIFPIMTTLTIYACGIILNKIDDKLKAERENAGKEQKKLLKQKAQKKKKAVATFFALGNLGVLLFLKYFNFFSSNVQAVLQKAGMIDGDIKLLHLVLPLGISFYTLQAVSYIVDVYRGTIKADRNLGRLALFICFFPTIVEGPIAKYESVACQAYEGHNFDAKHFARGAQIIIWGMFKKVVIADRISMLVGSVFDNYTQYSGTVIASAVLFYTIQIYCEFSGCMDIVTGSAHMMGIYLPKNFNHPMFSKTVNEFWRRWHITLGEWIRDYVFYPISLSKPIQKLGKWSRKHIRGNLGNILPAIIALFFVWFCNGFWHGASWKYICYGLYYYVIMTFGNLFQPMFSKIQTKLKINIASKPYKAFQIIRTFILVNIGMLIFRADSLSIAVNMFKSLFRSYDLSVLFDGTMLGLKLDAYDFIIIAVGVAVVLVVSILQEQGKSICDFISKRPVPLRWAIYLAAIFIIVIFGAYGPNYDVAAMIYAQF